jgi:thioredoxin 1
MFSQPSGAEVIYDRYNKVDKELYFEVYVVYRKDTSTSIFVPKELNYCVVESGAVEFLEDNITTPTTYGEVIVPGENWDYQEEIFNSNEPVVVALSATWAGTWKQVASTFTTTAQNHPEIKFIKLDADKHQEIIEALGLESVPQYKSYINGVEHANKVTGALTDQVLIELLS